MRPADESQPRDHVDSARLLSAENRAPLLESLHQVLKIRQSFRGGWGFNTKQDALEPTCLAILTLRHQSGAYVEKALNWIAQLQHQDGSWPVFDGAGREGSWTTALAVLCLLSVGSKGGSLQRAIGWLLSQRGREADWFWRWKFRTVDTDVRFDPTKYGWNWTPGTISWVIPTAFSLIALRRARNLDATAKLDERVKLGAAMIFDRMCPGGGWNAGNGEAFGIPYAPYIDATAIALLALRGHETEPGVHSSLSWLVNRLPACPSPYSVAWGVLALAAYRHISAANDTLDRSAKKLMALIERVVPDDVCTLAVCALALDAVEGDNVFEV